MISSSHARLEHKLNLLITEVRAGKREGSVISVQKFDTAARIDRDTWDAFRRELEDIGISPGVIAEKRQFIITWFQEAVAAGKLDEDSPFDDDSGIDSEGYSSSREESVMNDTHIGLGALRLGPNEHLLNPNRRSDFDIDSRKVEDAGMPSSFPARSSEKSPVPQQHIEKIGPSETYKVKSRLNVSYLLDELPGTPSERLTDAINTLNASKVKALLDQGVDANAIFDRGPYTMVQAAVNNRSTRIVELLLDHGEYVNSPEDSRLSAMHDAARKTDEAIMQISLGKVPMSTQGTPKERQLYIAPSYVLLLGSQEDLKG